MHSGFGSTAINALEEHFGGVGAKTNAQHRTKAKRLMDNQLFLFGTSMQSQTGKVSTISEQ